MPLSGDVVQEYLEKYPDATSRGLAHLIYQENTSLYPNPEAVRTAIRRYRGQQGNRHRESDLRRGTTEHFREAGSTDPFPKLPDPIDNLYANPYIEIEGERILVIGDTQIPYHDKQALELALKYGKDRDVDTVIILGDWLDFYQLSSYGKDPRERDWRGELDVANQGLRHVRGLFPDAQIIFKDGNHEERYDRYMQVKAPELLMISERFEYENQLGLRALGITHVDKMAHIKLGRLNLVHGHEWGGRGGGGVNPARWLFLRAQATAMCGHYHRTSNHRETDMDGSVTSTWSIGCLCTLRPRFMRYNKWNHGFAYIESDGYDFHVDNRIIIEGKVT